MAPTSEAEWLARTLRRALLPIIRRHTDAPSWFRGVAWTLVKAIERRYCIRPGEDLSAE